MLSSYICTNRYLIWPYCIFICSNHPPPISARYTAIPLAGCQLHLSWMDGWISRWLADVVTDRIVMMFVFCQSCAVTQVEHDVKEQKTRSQSRASALGGWGGWVGAWKTGSS